jgi:hypothetical protein
MIKPTINLLTSLEAFMRQLKFYILCFLVCAMHLLPNSALSMNAANSNDQVRLLSKNELHLAQQCSQRVGPFATQTTAWQRWRDAKSQGYAVSNGVVPCYDGGTSGYCFYVYFC